MKTTLQELENFKQRCKRRQVEIQKEIACLRTEYETLDSTIGNIGDVMDVLETEIEDKEQILTQNCDERCVAGEWCIFSKDGDNSNCPIKNGHVEGVE